NVRNDAPIEIERRYSFGGANMRFAGRIQEFATTTPEVQRKIVKCVVSVREGSKDRSVEPAGRIGEDARSLFELVPGHGRREVAAKLCAMGCLAVRIGEEIAAIDEALRAIMPWQRGEHF